MPGPSLSGDRLPDFAAQLSNSANARPSKITVEYLESVGLEADDSGLWERLTWEVRMGRSPDDGLRRAQFAAAVGGRRGSASTRDTVAAVADAAGREPRRLEPAGHIELGQGLTVANLCSFPVDVSAADAKAAHANSRHGDRMTLIVDEGEASSVRDGADGQVIWTAGIDGRPHEPWEALGDACGGLPEWLEGRVLRPLAARSGFLPGEAQSLAARVRGQMTHVLAAYEYGTDPNQLAEISEDDAREILDAVSQALDSMTREPRLVLPACNLLDLGPSEEHFRGSRMLEALLRMVTGDDRLVADALRSSPMLRLGHLGFAGAVQHHGDLLASTVSPFDCVAVLRPEMLASTVFFAGLPVPGADIPVPQRAGGLYSTVAAGEQVLEMLRVRVLLELSPAVPEHSRRFFQGHEINEMGLVSQGAPNAAFALLVTGIAQALEAPGPGLDAKVLAKAARQSVRQALTQVLARPPHGAIGGVHIGPIGIEDVEQIAVCLYSGEEYEAAANGMTPDYLAETSSYLSARGVRLRYRPPAKDAAANPRIA